MVNEEDNYDIHIIDYETRALTWTFGASDTKGSKPGYFNYPDDAHLLSDGKVVTADIRNCRVQFIDPETSTIIGQWGKEGTCKHDPPRFLAYPNGSTPLPNGDVLVTEITDAWITRLTRDGKVVWSVRAPAMCVIRPTRSRRATGGSSSPTSRNPAASSSSNRSPRKVAVGVLRARRRTKVLDHPSLALELPNGNVVANDDAAAPRHCHRPRHQGHRLAVWRH